MERFALSLEGVVLSHGKGRQINTPWNLKIPRGGITSIVGPNGVGKTSLLRALLGEPVITQGEIFLGERGTPVSKISPAQLAAQIAYVPQEHLFPADLLLKDLLRIAFLPKIGMFGKLSLEDEKKIRRMAERLELGALMDRPMKALSSGERQRAFLTRAMLQQSALLLLDEPTNHLDPGATAKFWKLLKENVAASELSVLLSSHDLEWVAKYSDRVLGLRGGEIVWWGPIPPDKVDSLRQICF